MEPERSLTLDLSNLPELAEAEREFSAAYRLWRDPQHPELLAASAKFTASVKAALEKYSQHPAKAQIDDLERRLQDLLTAFFATQAHKVADQVVAMVEKRATHKAVDYGNLRRAFAYEKVILIRHAEKPEDGPHLSAEGLAHARRLAETIPAKYGVPDIVFAAADSETSHRCVETAEPLVARYHLRFEHDIARDQIDAAAGAIRAHAGALVLVVWPHENLPALAEALDGQHRDKWPEGDFSTQWEITLPAKAAKAFDEDEPRDAHGRWGEGGEAKRPPKFPISAKNAKRQGFIYHGAGFGPAGEKVIEQIKQDGMTAGFFSSQPHPEYGPAKGDAEFLAMRQEDLGEHRSWHGPDGQMWILPAKATVYWPAWKDGDRIAPDKLYVADREGNILRPLIASTAKAFNPDQPRDDHGRWGEGGGYQLTEAGQKTIDAWVHFGAGDYAALKDSQEFAKDLRSMPQREGTVYRGALMSPDELAEMKPGETFEFKQNCSTTAMDQEWGPSIAATFTTKPFGGTNVQGKPGADYGNKTEPVVMTLEGAKGADLAAVNMGGAQAAAKWSPPYLKETIIPIGERFKVVSVASAEMRIHTIASEGKYFNWKYTSVVLRAEGASKTAGAGTIAKSGESPDTLALRRIVEADSGLVRVTAKVIAAERAWFEDAVRNWPLVPEVIDRGTEAMIRIFGSGEKMAGGSEGANLVSSVAEFAKTADRLPIQRITFQGFPVSIENPVGTYRVWGKPTDADGGRTLVLFAYGYIRRSMAEDGDHVDAYIGPNENAREVYVVRQLNPWTGEQDEDKCFLGFNSVQEARAAFLAHWDPVLGPKAFGGITAYPVEEFRQKVHETMKRPGAVKIAFGYLAEKAFNEDQPRDSHGRWTDGGSEPQHEGELSISPMRMADMTDEQREKERARLREVHGRQRMAAREKARQEKERAGNFARDAAYEDAKREASGQAEGRPLNSLKLNNVVDAMSKDSEGYTQIPTTPRDPFATTLQDAVKGMPEALHNDLADAGYRVWAAPTCKSMYSDPERQTQLENAIGFHNLDSHQIVVAKYAGDGATLVRDPSDVLYHEAGHAVDYAIGNGKPDNNAANSAEFTAAQKADREAMNPSDFARWSYFVNPQHDGEPLRSKMPAYGEFRARQESFAQLFSDGVNSHLDIDARYPSSNRSDNPPPKFGGLSALMPRTYDVVKGISRERGYYSGGKQAKFF